MLIFAQSVTHAFRGVLPEELPAEGTLAEGRGSSVEGCSSPLPCVLTAYSEVLKFVTACSSRKIDTIFLRASRKLSEYVFTNLVED